MPPIGGLSSGPLENRTLALRLESPRQARVLSFLFRVRECGLTDLLDR